MTPLFKKNDPSLPWDEKVAEGPPKSAEEKPKTEIQKPKRIKITIVIASVILAIGLTYISSFIKTQSAWDKCYNKQNGGLPFQYSHQLEQIIPPNKACYTIMGEEVAFFLFPEIIYDFSIYFLITSIIISYFFRHKIKNYRRFVIKLIIFAVIISMISWLFYLYLWSNSDI
ncbi:MAG: hypothetical protein ABIH38_05425 [Patescibacteria group bacterium]